MIKVEGYKAFRGEMKISPKNILITPFVVRADWLYKPETNCWYGGGASYPVEICEVVSDESVQ